VERKVYFLESKITDFSLPQAVSVTDDQVRDDETRINSAADGVVSFFQLICRTYGWGRVKFQWRTRDVCLSQGAKRNIKTNKRYAI